jgi:dihydrofolate reductase
MRKLYVTTFLTLDGVMQAPGGPEEDPRGDFPYGGWSAGYWDDVMNQEMGDFMNRPFDLLLGRRTYDLFASFWPTAPAEAGGAPLNAATKYVASRGRPALTWDRSVQLDGDAAEAVAALKATDGPELQVHGSGNLVQTLLQNNLVDEFHLMIHPVILGKGKRLFGDGAIPAGLQVTESKVSPSGVVIASYVPAGEVKFGTMGS